jgi:hypothetical protein
MVDVVTDREIAEAEVFSVLLLLLRDRGMASSAPYSSTKAS